MIKKKLKAKGECDYDYVNDILFFKVKEREYSKSIEFSNFVFDVDSEDFITGIQIFNASEYLGIKKSHLMNIPKWHLNVEIQEGILEIKLLFQVCIRNKCIEMKPIIHQPTELPDSEIMCEAISSSC